MGIWRCSIECGSRAARAPWDEWNLCTYLQFSVAACLDAVEIQATSHTTSYIISTHQFRVGPRENRPSSAFALFNRHIRVGAGKRAAARKGDGRARQVGSSDQVTETIY